MGTENDRQHVGGRVRFLEGPVLLTNSPVWAWCVTAVEWGNGKFQGTDNFSLPVVGETWDGELNDINGFM
jgi:hypothetical protein